MSRLKLVLLVLIIAALGIVFVQNRDPLVLKLLCPDNTQSCLYQTPNLSLAIWMALFMLGGLVTSLLGQALNRYRYAGAGRSRPNSDDFVEDRNKWSAKDTRSDRYPYDERVQDTTRDQYSSGSYEVPQKPESVERSGSTYSYKYRDADEGNSSRKSVNNLPKKDDKNQKTSIDSEIDSKFDRDKDDEDWI